MTQRDQNYIKEIAQELALAMHQSRDKEVSGLFSEIKDDIGELRKEVETMRSQIQPILSEAEFSRQFWAKVKTGGNFLTWTVGVIAAALIALGYVKVSLLTWLSSRIL